MTKEIEAIKSYDLAKPAEAIKMAAVVKDHIVRQGLYSNISGRNYAHVEGWQFAGFLSGLHARVVEVTDLSKGDVVKWKAEVEILKGEQVLSGGFAICSDEEAKRKNADEYVILSMAQTRAIGKAYRNLIGWLMKAAGYEATPAEEMTEKVAERPRAAEGNPRAAHEKAGARMTAAKSVEALNAVWRSLPAVIRKDDELLALGRELKKKLS